MLDAELFVVEGKGHAFDEPLFLGDPDLREVEAAWDALEGKVEKAIAVKEPL
jgi:hypothetical protein